MQTRLNHTCPLLSWSSGCRVNEVNNKERTPLHEAAEAGHVAMVKLLLAGGGNPLLREGDFDATPYMLANKTQRKEVGGVTGSLGGWGYRGGMALWPNLLLLLRSVRSSKTTSAPTRGCTALQPLWMVPTLVQWRLLLSALPTPWCLQVVTHRSAILWCRGDNMEVTDCGRVFLLGHTVETK